MNSESVSNGTNATDTGDAPPPRGLYFHRIVKRFGGTRALRDVTLNVERGEIVALLGENGAGKSTLIKILGGIHQPDSGAIAVDRVPYRHKPGNIRTRQAVAFIHQDLGLIDWMSISENIALAQGFPRRAGLIDRKACDAVTREALRRIGCDFSPSMRVQRLSRTEKSLVAIARALAVDCDYLVLDEPTASLPSQDVSTLFDVLAGLRSEGVGMIYVSHRLDETFRIADRVVVLRDGAVVGVRDVAETNPADLVDLIVGREPRSVERLPERERDVVLDVQALRTGITGPVSLQVSTGEVLGLVGLRGAGQEDIGRCLFGATPFAGSVTLSGAPYVPGSPGAAMRAGVGLIPRERVNESIAPSLSIRENFYLNPGAVGRRLFGFRSRRRESREAVAAGRQVGLRPNDPDLPIEALSGGNQQKVIVGRWIATRSRILIAEDPTAGVDVGAKAEIYALLNELVKDGVAVIVISTDFEEVAAICHRALVFNRGRCIDQLQGDELTTEKLVTAASATDYDADTLAAHESRRIDPTDTGRRHRKEDDTRP